MKLLIVEDNPQMRQLLKSLVSDLAEAIAECDDGERAVAAYTAQGMNDQDRVLMDLQMPHVGGLEATRRLIEADPGAHVIIVTQHDDSHWREAARQAGARGYVLKEDLLEVRRLLTGRGRPDWPSRP